MLQYSIHLFKNDHGFKNGYFFYPKQVFLLLISIWQQRTSFYTNVNEKNCGSF